MKKIKSGIEAHLTIEDFRKGRDTVVETALSFLENQNK
jgi:hypothetical protein